MVDKTIKSCVFDCDMSKLFICVLKGALTLKPYKFQFRRWELIKLKFINFFDLVLPDLLIELNSNFNNFRLSVNNQSKLFNWIMVDDCRLLNKMGGIEIKKSPIDYFKLLAKLKNQVTTQFSMCVLIDYFLLLRFLIKRQLIFYSFSLFGLFKNNLKFFKIKFNFFNYYNDLSNLIIYSKIFKNYFGFSKFQINLFNTQSFKNSQLNMCSSIDLNYLFFDFKKTKNYINNVVGVILININIKQISLVYYNYLKTLKVVFYLLLNNTTFLFQKQFKDELIINNCCGSVQLFTNVYELLKNYSKSPQLINSINIYADSNSTLIVKKLTVFLKYLFMKAVNLFYFDFKNNNFIDKISINKLKICVGFYFYFIKFNFLLSNYLNYCNNSFDQSFTFYYLNFFFKNYLSVFFGKNFSFFKVTNNLYDYNLYLYNCFGQLKYLNAVKKNLSIFTSNEIIINLFGAFFKLIKNNVEFEVKSNGIDFFYFLLSRLTYLYNLVNKPQVFYNQFSKNFIKTFNFAKNLIKLNCFEFICNSTNSYLNKIYKKSNVIINNY